MIEYGFDMDNGSVKLSIRIKAKDTISAKKKLAKFLEKRFKVSRSYSAKLAEKYNLTSIRFIQPAISVAPKQKTPKSKKK